VSHASAPGTLPANYHEVLYWKLTSPWRLVAVNLLSLPLLLVFGPCFLVFAIAVGRANQVRVFDEVGAVRNTGALLLALGLVVPLHEFAHGVAMRVFGARPKYGVIWRGLMFFATAPGHAFSRNQYLAVILAPLASLSLLAVVGMVVFTGTWMVMVLALCAAINAASASGDLWMASVVVRQPPDAFVVDEREGMRLFLPV
jgi:hypothetical protein